MISPLLPTCLGFSFALGGGVSQSHSSAAHLPLQHCVATAPFNITVLQVHAPTNNAEEAEVERFYKDLKDILELIHTQKDVFFIMGTGMQK